MPNAIEMNFSRRSIYDSRIVTSAYVLTYLFEQYINNIIGSNIIGPVLLLFVSFLLFSRLGIKYFAIPKMFGIWFLSAVLFTTFAFVSPFGCHISIKSIASLLLLLLILIQFDIANFSKISLDKITSNAILIVIIILLIMGSLNLAFSGNSGPYFEPSHLASYLLPIVTLKLFLNSKDFVAIVAIFACMLFSPSSTLFLSLLAIVLIITTRRDNNKTWTRYAAILLVILVFSVAIVFDVLDISKFSDRVQGVLGGYDETVRPNNNLSSLVWLNGWSQAYDTLQATYWLGTGFNQMGCGRFGEVGSLSVLILESTGVILNYNDGSILAAKLIAEFGIFGIFSVIAVTIFSLRSIFIFHSNSIFSVVRATRAAGAICMISFLFIRGFGYFVLPLWVALSMLSISNSLNITTRIRVFPKILTKN